MDSVFPPQVPHVRMLAERNHGPGGQLGAVNSGHPSTHAAGRRGRPGPGGSPPTVRPEGQEGRRQEGGQEAGHEREGGKGLGKCLRWCECLFVCVWVFLSYLLFMSL